MCFAEGEMRVVCDDSDMAGAYGGGWIAAGV